MDKTGSKRTKLSDRELIAAALEGDQTALTALLERYRGPLIAHLMGYVRVLEDAEDICQKSFLKVYMNIDKYDSSYAFSTWLYNIARNEAVDHLRRKSNSIAPLLVEQEGDAAEVAGADNPEEKIILDQAIAKSLENLSRLPETYREVAELRFLRDLSYEDISRILSLPMGTVKTRIRRARKLLMEE